MAKLEDFLKGKPLNARMAELMRLRDEEPAEVVPIEAPRNYADGKPLDDVDREHLRKLLTMPGWAVFLKLLDTKCSELEDAARVASMQAPFAEANSEAWAEASYFKRAREHLLNSAEAEIAKLRVKRKKNA